MSVKISSKLPSDERNGLVAISAALCDNPEGSHVIIAVVDCSQITTNIDNGDVIPTARVMAVEAFESASVEANRLREMLRLHFQRRTGRRELPLDEA